MHVSRDRECVVRQASLFQVKINRKFMVRGGILGDIMGYGKTVRLPHLNGCEKYFVLNIVIEQLYETRTYPSVRCSAR